jgi:hypothetical protein
VARPEDTTGSPGMSQCSNNEGSISVKKRYKVLLALLCLWLFAVLATLPELIAVWSERKIVRQTFSNYADALVNRNFEEAYGYQSPEFRESVSLDSFMRYQRDVEAKFGLLKSVEQEGMTVHKWRKPSRWRATIVADFQYAKAKVRFTFELHREDGPWTIFSSSGEEK